MHLLFDCLEGVSLDDKIPKQRHAIHRLIGKDNPSYRDLLDLRSTIHDMLYVDNMSPKEVGDAFGCHGKDFGMFIKKCLGIKLRGLSDAQVNYRVKTGSRSKGKDIYLRNCMFTFDPYAYPSIPGYDLLLEFGIYHPFNNPNGVCRDHMVSREFGWRNDIDPTIIASVYNCQYMTNHDNIKKGSACSLTIEELMSRISSCSFTQVVSHSKQLPKTTSHKSKLSSALKEHHSKHMIITNGAVNKWIDKNQDIPIGFRKGMSRRLVGCPGLEPGN